MNLEILNKKIESTEKSIDLLVSAIKAVQEVFKIDDDRIYSLKNKINSLEIENSNMKKRISFLETQHHIFW